MYFKISICFHRIDLFYLQNLNILVLHSDLIQQYTNVTNIITVTCKDPLDAIFDTTWKGTLLENRLHFFSKIDRIIDIKIRIIRCLLFTILLKDSEKSNVWIWHVFKACVFCNQSICNSLELLVILQCMLKNSSPMEVL